ncbi:MAG: ABC transporter ATP-binding protein [Candidatus Njordarchaeia archaeon]
MDNGEIVKLENVHKIYQLGVSEVHALRGINLEIKYGEIVSIIGPSGSGKTTLLNIIGTLDKPTKGHVYIEGQDTAQMNEKQLTQLRRHKIGFVFQFHNLIPVLTALENVELPMIIAGKPREERIKRAKHLLKLVGLENRMNHRPSELSGGEQQRVAIARALANKPKLVLADEPTGELDTENSKTVMKILEEAVKEEEGTLVVVTHNPLIAQMAKRLISIKDGKIISDKNL